MVALVPWVSVPTWSSTSFWICDFQPYSQELGKHKVGPSPYQTHSVLNLGLDSVYHVTVPASLRSSGQSWGLAYRNSDRDGYGPSEKQKQLNNIQ